MPDPSQQELNESIELITAYRKRLRTEVKVAAKKLQMPPKKIGLTLDTNKELIELQRTLDSLHSLLSKKESQ